MNIKKFNIEKIQIIILMQTLNLLDDHFSYLYFKLFYYFTIYLLFFLLQNKYIFLITLKNFIINLNI